MNSGSVGRARFHLLANRFVNLEAVSLCLLAAAIAWFSQRNAVLQEALLGYSPVGMMHPLDEFHGFVRNFPNGEAEMSRSIIAHLYGGLGSAGASDRQGATFVVFLEALTMMAGATLFSRSANPHLPRWMAVCAGLLLAAGSIASADFGRWFHPFYGSVYNFALGLGMAANAAALQRKPIWAGFALSIGAMVHPIITLFMALPAATIVLLDLRHYRVWTLAAAAVAAVVPFLAWFSYAYAGAEISGSSVDPQVFGTLTRLMSAHWHPLRLGIFGERAWESLLPFSALLLVTAAMMASAPESVRRQDRHLVMAMGAIFAVSLAGLYASVFAESPLLIKLSLHRASLGILLLSAGIALPRLLNTILQAPIIVSAIGAGLIASCFVRPHGMPILGVLLFLGSLYVSSRHSTQSARKPMRIFMLAGAGVLIALSLSGHVSAILVDTMMTLTVFWSAAFWSTWILILLARWRHTPGLAWAGVLSGALLWCPQTDNLRAAEDRSNAAFYKEAQDWARQNTSIGTVFMLDPTIGYGWRHYSQRPSFGTLREWLYAGWIYNSDPAVMKEGLRRAALFGADLQVLREAVANADTNNSAYFALLDKVRKNYNNSGAQMLRSISLQNGIDYFLFDREERTNMTGLQIVYSNDRYVIVKP